MQFQLAILIFHAASNPTHKPQYLITNIYCIQEQSFAALLVNFVQFIVYCKKNYAIDNKLYEIN